MKVLVLGSGKKIYGRNINNYRCVPLYCSEIFKTVISDNSNHIFYLDMDENLKPDYIANVNKLNWSKNVNIKFDTISPMCKSIICKGKIPFKYKPEFTTECRKILKEDGKLYGFCLFEISY